MENASKALIIAGAILISILLISVGIMVMNSIAGVQSGAEGQMDAMAVQTFNTKITQYAGTNRRGTVVKSLYDAVIAQNSAFPDNLVSINGKTEKTDLSAAMAGTSATARFNITIDGYDEQGLINSIKIESAGAGSQAGSASPAA